ncbi:MAG: hypothetical protein WBA17_06315 [Saprospiraceae bacterium]
MARGFNELQQPENIDLSEAIEIKALIDHFGRGVADEDWIPEVGKLGACFLTKDVQIRRKRVQFELCKKYQAGAFFLKVGSKKQSARHWEQVKFLVKQWPKMMKLALETERPFAFEITSRSIRML